MVQHATTAVSIAGSILLCLVFIGLVYDLIAGYSARRRFAKLLTEHLIRQYQLGNIGYYCRCAERRFGSSLTRRLRLLRPE
jgi:hypothetical protein